MASENHRSTARILDILELLASSKNGYTLTEIAETINAPKSSIFPIVHTLLDRKYIELNSHSLKYSIGIGLFALSSTFFGHKNIFNYVLDEMSGIVDKCAEACQLGILDKDYVLYIGKVDAPQPVRMASHVGTRLPANCASLGKALLCDYSKEELKKIFENGMNTLTSKSLTDIDILHEQLVEIRKTQIACEYEEVADHIQCFAVPLRKNGRINAALGITIPTFRATEEKISLIKSLLLEYQIRIQNIMTELNSGISST